MARHRARWVRCCVLLLMPLVTLLACATMGARDRADAPVSLPGETPCDALARRIVQGRHSEWLPLWMSFCAPPSIWGPRGRMTYPQRTDSLRWTEE